MGSRLAGMSPRPTRLLGLGSSLLVALLAAGGAIGLWPVGSPAGTAPTAHAAQPAGMPFVERPMLLAASVLDLRDFHGLVPGARALHGSTPTRPKAEPTRPPRVPAHSGQGRRVVFDISAQRVWLVRADGTAARSYLVSGSRFDNLRPGSYSVYSRSEQATSYTLDETMRYMVRFARGERAAIGFHEIPVNASGKPLQTKAQLGTPLSAGCVRQATPDAKALWRFAPVGTPVVVVA